jgi:hypothetical protein
MKNSAGRQSIQNARPDWAIGYAQYVLTDLFSSSDRDQILETIKTAAETGLPNLDSPGAQHIIVGLKSYANMQGELNKLNNPLVIKALSQAVATEARVALQMATSKRNMELMIKSQHPDISQEDLADDIQRVTQGLQERPLQEDGKDLYLDLLEGHLKRQFESYHTQDIFSFSQEALNKYIGDGR